MAENDHYVLGDRDETELERLRFQHEVWRDVVDPALDEAGFGEGDVVADLGCGPGFLSMDLAGRVAPGGRVLAVDQSERFIDDLRDRARREGHPEIEARVGDVARPIADPASLDGAVCRWVLMFVSDPEAVLAAVADALKPGGRVVAMEYFQFRAISLHPTGAAFDTLYGAVHRLIRAAGGDPDIGGRLPTLLHAAGLEVTGLRPVLRAGRPGTPEWAWLEGTHQNHQGLVDAGLLSAEQLEAYAREWERATANPNAFFSGPPVLIVTARKPA
jgi:SAM-dependent methyltransferase